MTAIPNRLLLDCMAIEQQYHLNCHLLAEEQKLKCPLEEANGFMLKAIYHRAMATIIGNPLHRVYDDLALDIEKTYSYINLVRQDAKNKVVNWPIDNTTRRILGHLPAAIESIVRSLDPEAVIRVQGFYYIVEFSMKK
jgi:hypothetical protein